MVVPDGHRLEADATTFLGNVVHCTQGDHTETLWDLRELNGLKFQLALKVLLPKGGRDEETKEAIFRSVQVPILNAHEIDLNEPIATILEKIEKYTNEGSWWVVKRVDLLWLNVAAYQPLRGRSYIPLPKEVKDKNAVANVKNKDDDCLRWSLRAALYPVAVHAERPSKHPKDDGLDFRGIDRPTPLSQIAKVEKQNQLDINAYGWDKAVTVLHISNEPRDIRRINVLLFEKDCKWHNTWIKNLNRLLYNQTLHKCKKYFCERCLYGYSKEELLKVQEPECGGIRDRATHIEMPKEGEDVLQFVNHHRQLKVPYIIYADFEALTTKVQTCERDPSQSCTQKIEQHEVCGFCYMVVRCDGHSEEPVLYRGRDAARQFLDRLKEEEHKIEEALKHLKRLAMTRQDWRQYNAYTTCHVCTNPLNGDSVRDHCHITGAFRGAAHSACNLELRLNQTIPVVFHNLRGYDSHLIMQAICRASTQRKERSHASQTTWKNTSPSGCAVLDS